MIVSHHTPAPRKARSPVRLLLVVIAVAIVMIACLFLALQDWSSFQGTKARALSLNERGEGQSGGLPDIAPVSSPDALRNVSPEEAERINAAIPLSATSNPPARPLSILVEDAQVFGRALTCMTSAIYYEAASESDEGQRAVAQVVLNRVRHPAFPNTVCGVVYQGSERKTGCQFSFTCDGSLARSPSISGWARARSIAQQALSGYVFSPVGWSTHYHTHWVAPYWAPTLTKAAVIGAHIFYRWPGNWGRPGAFSQRHAGIEPDAAGIPIPEEGDKATLLAESDTSATPAARPVLSIDGKLASGAVPLSYTAGEHPRAVNNVMAGRWVIPGVPAATGAPPSAPTGTTPEGKP